MFLCLVILVSLACTAALLKNPTVVKNPSVTPLRSLQTNQEPVSTNSQLKQKLTLGTIAGLFAVGSFTAQKAMAAENKNFSREPTAEFLEEEKKARALAAGQKKDRFEWDALLNKFKAVEGDSPAMAKSLDDMTAFLKKLEGIPSGLKKVDIVKAGRAAKFLGEGRKITLLKTKPTWTTDCEIAYTALIAEFNKQMLPDNRQEKGTF